MRRVFSGVVFSVCLLGSACSTSASGGEGLGDGERPSDPRGLSGHRASSDDGAPPEELAFDEATGRFDELRLAMVRPVAYTPAEVAIADQGAVIVADLLYDGLTEAVGTEARLRPALAKRWWPDVDGTAWTFAIDTDRITADAVADHLGRLLREPPNAGVALLLDGVRAVEAVGEGNVRFVLDGPNAGLPWLVSGLPLSIVGPGGETTGRYRVATEDDAGMVLEPGDTSAGPTVTLTWTDTARRAYDQLTLTLVDAAVVPPDDLDDAVRRYGVTVRARSLTRFYVLNPASPALTDSQIRAAVVAAIDREAVAEDGYPWPVTAVDGVVAPTTAGYRNAACGVPCRHDPGRVAALLSGAHGTGELDSTSLRLGSTSSRPDVAGAGEAGPTLTLRLAVVGEDQIAPARAVARQLDEVGIGVDVVELAPEELAAIIRAGEADLYAFGWAAGAGSIDAVVPHLFGSGSPANGTGVASERVDELIALAAGIADDGARWAVLGDAHRRALAEGFVAPLVAAPSTLVAAPHAQHLVVRADGSLDVSSSR